MRFPVNNFYTEWNTTAGFGFGSKTDYGAHEAIDLNLNGGGNVDLGQPLFAIADGIVTSVHSHSVKPSFGKHIHYKIEGEWGTRYVHYAHCDSILVSEGQELKEGQQIATVGNTGTVYAHCHWAIKKVPTGVDAIAKTLDDLNKWENPLTFVEQWIEGTDTSLQKELDKARKERDDNHDDRMALYSELGFNGKFNRMVAETEIRQLKEIAKKSGEKDEELKELRKELSVVREELRVAKEKIEELQTTAQQTSVATDVVSSQIDNTIEKAENIEKKIDASVKDDEPLWWEKLIVWIKKLFGRG